MRQPGALAFLARRAVLKGCRNDVTVKQVKTSLKETLPPCLLDTLLEEFQVRKCAQQLTRKVISQHFVKYEIKKTLYSFHYRVRTGKNDKKCSLCDIHVGRRYGTAPYLLVNIIERKLFALYTNDRVILPDKLFAESLVHRWLDDNTYVTESCSLLRGRNFSYYNLLR